MMQPSPPAVPDAGLIGILPVARTVVIMPSVVTLRTRFPPPMYRFPRRSTARLDAPNRRAAFAGPPSPESPRSLPPAMVVDEAV